MISALRETRDRRLKLVVESKPLSVLFVSGVGGGGSNPEGSSVAGSNSTEREDGSGWSWGSVAREVGRQIATQFVVAAVCFFLTVYVFGFPNPFERKRARGRLRDGEGEL